MSNQQKLVYMSLGLQPELKRHYERFAAEEESTLAKWIRDVLRKEYRERATSGSGRRSAYTAPTLAPAAAHGAPKEPEKLKGAGRDGSIMPGDRLYELAVINDQRRERGDKPMSVSEFMVMKGVSKV